MKKKKSKFFRYVVIICISVIVLGVIAKKAGWIGGSSKTKVAVEKSEKRNLTEKVSASGKIYATSEVKISSDVSGEIVELLVAEGDSVRPGQKLIRIKPDNYQAAVDRAIAALNSAKANYLNAQAQLKQMQVEEEKAKINFERNKKLHDQKVISDADFENVDAAYKAAKANVESSTQSVEGARFNVQSAEATVKDANENLDKTTIFSPAAGIVSKLSVEKGERVTGTSMMAGTELLRIANLYQMETRVEVSENDVLRVKVGDTSEVEIDAYPDIKFNGVVASVAYSSTGTDNPLSSEQVTNFTVKIRLLRDEQVMKLFDEKKIKFPFLPGMSASVDIITKRLSKVLTVPIQSVTTREDTTRKMTSKKDSIKNRNQVVFVLEEGKVKMAKVKNGIQDDTYIEVTSGLKENQTVITLPYSVVSRELEEGDEVTVVDKKELFKDK